MPICKAGSYEVETFEIGVGPTVVLVHSSASGLRQWRRLMDELKHEFRVVAVNLFGYGATSVWPAERTQSLADQAALVTAVISQLDAPFTLVGHSLGAAVALEAAMQLPRRLRAVIVFEPILFSLLQVHGPADGFAEIRDLASRYHMLGRDGRWDAAGELFVDYWSGAGSWAAMSEERKTGLRGMLPNVLHEWDAVIAPTRGLSEWLDVAAPVHVMRAADTRRPTHAIASLLVESDRRWTLHELPEGGHMAPVTRADLVNPVIRRLLDEFGP